ncbi:MAG TPA: PHB depolymerase family esterase, partial [Crenalkalicoccus sp.]|nr:PHB depolymerase family esterase [Crenalkalicoccus sp.]
MASSRTSLADLVRVKRRLQRAAPNAAPAGPSGAPHLEELTDFGANPGNLRMLAFLPPDLPQGAPLLVALHGCTQTAAGFDRGTGWSGLAASRRFALLLPEQRPANNPNRCFNWFESGETTRGGGEVASIAEAVRYLVARHGLDRRRVFVTGLSAGGGMASALLATYPELFAAGAIIAGLPYGVARSIPEAFEAMAGHRIRPAPELASLVRAAAPHRGPWPRVSIWQGEADRTVAPANATELVKQWTTLHGLVDGATRVLVRPGHHISEWADPAGRVVVERHDIAGMGHGVPLAAGEGEGQAGQAGPFLLDVGISSTHAIADFLGLDQPATRRAPRPQ